MSNSDNIKDLQFKSINELLEDYNNSKNTIAIFEEIVLRAKRFEYYMENICDNIEFTVRDYDKRINSIEKDIRDIRDYLYSLDKRTMSFEVIK